MINLALCVLDRSQKLSYLQWRLPLHSHAKHFTVSLHIGMPCCRCRKRYWTGMLSAVNLASWMHVELVTALGSWWMCRMCKPSLPVSVTVGDETFDFFHARSLVLSWLRLYEGGQHCMWLVLYVCSVREAGKQQHFIKCMQLQVLQKGPSSSHLIGQALRSSL